MTPLQNSEIRFTGLPISPGVVLAGVCLFRQSRHNALPSYEVTGKSIDREKTRLAKAREIVVERLENLTSTVTDRIGPAEAGIFVAQKMMLQDPVLCGEMNEAIDEGCNAERAATQTLDGYESQLAQLDDEYIKERASDLGELKRRLLDVLCNTSPSFQCSADSKCRRGNDRVVVTEELTPSIAMEIEANHVLGFITERGGKTSHAAILARALGIPAVSGIADIHNQIPCGTEVLINGNTGEVVVRPSAQTKAATAAQTVTPQAIEAVEPVDHFTVMANISSAAEAGLAVEMRAEGVGLYRTEFEFFAAGGTLDEDQQYELYLSVAVAMEGRPVYFRMLDIGADKPLTGLNLPKEDNPALGYRGARLLLGRPDLMRPQARALARVSSEFPVHVMYPMITGLHQFRMLKQTFEEMTADISPRRLYHGVMFEVPSACMEAQLLLEEVDFASIGSNDLIQYIFAVDRNNSIVAVDHRPDYDVFWRLLENLSLAADLAGTPISLCGELASDVQYTDRLIASGIRMASVSARRISDVRRSAVQAEIQRRARAPDYSV
ncbi:MAG: phosphoenolpyruvate--protein phosphotransferase [Phycisphaerae bacterium]|jgi:phosphotransferase system enzyme I (PtsI)|nr:phosphoenolpyruvate--protein phosphotransferase [Phycisphaerae bacterium]